MKRFFAPLTGCRLGMRRMVAGLAASLRSRLVRRGDGASLTRWGRMGAAPLLAFFVFVFVFIPSASAQDYVTHGVELPVDLYEGDTIPVVHLRDVFIFSPPEFKNRRMEKAYWRTVRDVKRTLPLAREIRGIIVETYEYLQTLPDDGSRERHMRRVEKDLMDTYTPRMKQLTLRQGKLLIRLVDRECNQTSYELIAVFRGRMRAAFYQAFAAVFGASLRTGYDAEGDDAEIEEIIWAVDNGAL